MLRLYSLLAIQLSVVGGLAYFKASDNVLDELTAPSSPFLSRVCGGIFAYTIIGLGIPIFCVLMRYNLVSGRVCTLATGKFLGAWLPWIVSWMVYRGHGILALLSWSGLVLNSLVDFIFPCVAVLFCLRRRFANETPARTRISLQDNERRHLVQSVYAVSQSPDGHAPLPRFLMSRYEEIARILLYLVAFLVAVGLTLKIEYALESCIRKWHRGSNPSPFDFD